MPYHMHTGNEVGGYTSEFVDADLLDSTDSSSHLPAFRCQYGQEVHYTLVCDGHGNCPDGSDETSCVKPRLPPLFQESFVCRAGQTVPTLKHCDGVLDCFDESDEEGCLLCTGKSVMCAGMGCFPKAYSIYVDQCPQLAEQGDTDLPNGIVEIASVSLDGTGMSKLSVTHSCSESEFRCVNGMCVPSYLVNNGELDCMYGEDENIPVENVTCPGYYRCQGAGLCVHVDYLCDGVYHCPNKDDECYCDIQCPANCTCEGHAYTCWRMFGPLLSLQVRYLDLSGVENPPLDHFYVMEFLLFLNLSSCALHYVSLTDMPQLRVLDLSFNGLKNISSLALQGLSGLTRLDLSNNPLVKTLGASFRVFLDRANMKALQVLTMRNSELTVIQNRIFENLPHLVSLDIRHNNLVQFDKDVFCGLHHLQTLHTDNSKLCCPFFHRHAVDCHAPKDELSSCSNLLRLDFFRMCLWSLSILAMTGNAGCLVYRLFFRKQTGPLTTRVLIGNLAASDLLMGLYLMIIGTADVYFRDVYVSKESEWTESVLCSVAGFLAFVSCEVSAFMVCMVTVERLLVLSFPLHTNVHITPRVAAAACGLAWVAGVALAAVPILAKWQFYGQNGMCVPIPITRLQFEGQGYAFAVFIVLNFALFLVVGVGQALVFRSVQKTAYGAGIERRQQDNVIARRLLLVVATDFLCWFPVGLIALLVSGGTPVPSVVYVWIAIFVLPLNSALNPFLYTLNGLGERWKKQREQARSRLWAQMHE